jgi:hypothetical protein
MPINRWTASWSGWLHLLFQDAATPPDECTRHLPYFKLLKVFSAAPEDRPVLMAQYMDDWYEASRREHYYRSHTKGRDHNFLGYWSFEAAAVTVLLDIDDSSYPRSRVLSEGHGRTLAELIDKTPLRMQATRRVASACAAKPVNPCPPRRRMGNPRPGQQPPQLQAR